MSSFFAVIGALIGKQKGRNIEVMNSFELVFNVIAGDVIIDRDYYNTKEEHCKFHIFRCGFVTNKLFCVVVKQVFNDMDFLGWYTTGDMPDFGDVKIHKQICEINECPILFKLNPVARNGDVCIVFMRCCMLVMMMECFNF